MNERRQGPPVSTGAPGAAGEPRRTYRSTLRDEQAADTRRRIVHAARELFGSQGFTATTVADIAGRAGVSQPTVYAVLGSKGEIMRALLARLEDDADAATWKARIDAEKDPRRKLDWYAAWHRELFSRGRDVLAAALGAGNEAGVVEFRKQGDRSAREWLAPVVSSLATSGALRPGLDEQTALELGWMLTGPELYFRATDGCGWSDDAYQELLGRLLRQQLLTAPD